MGRRRNSNDPFGFGDFGMGNLDFGLGSSSKSGRKRSGNNDPFGGNFDFDFGLGNVAKSSRLATNKLKGKMAEDTCALDHTLQGHEVKRIHKGGDFIIRDRHGNTTIVEVKTGNAKLSDAQKRKKDRMGNRRYKVERYY